MKTNLNLKIKDYVIIILGVLSIALLLGLCVTYNKYKETKKEIVIWTDEVYSYINKYNEEYAAKKTYILKAEQLEEYNKQLFEEYQSLKDHPLVITNTEILFKTDTVNTSIYDLFFTNNKIKWEWQAKDSTYYSINGESGVTIKDSTECNVYTTIFNQEMNANLTMDVIDDGKQLSVIAKTNNPYVSLHNMQSVVIDPNTCPTIKNYFKPKRWGFGPSIGAGILYGIDFNSNSIVGVGGYIGIGLHYDIFQW